MSISIDIISKTTNQKGETMVDCEAKQLFSPCIPKMGDTIGIYGDLRTVDQIIYYPDNVIIDGVPVNSFADVLIVVIKETKP